MDAVDTCVDDPIAKPILCFLVSETFAHAEFLLAHPLKGFPGGKASEQKVVPPDGRVEVNLRGIFVS